MNNIIINLVMPAFTGIATTVATVIIAYYAKVQHDFLKFQTKSQYNKLKDWIFERIIEQNVNELEHKFQKMNVDDHLAWVRTSARLHVPIQKNRLSCKR